MSDLDKIDEALDRIFHEEGARIVFWNDPEREFLNVLPLLSFEDVRKIRLDQEASLGVKILLERDDPTASTSSTRRPRSPTTRTTGSWTSASTAAASGRTGRRSCSINSACSTRGSVSTSPTAASSSTARIGSRSSGCWSPPPTSSPTWTGR